MGAFLMEAAFETRYRIYLYLKVEYAHNYES